METSYRTLLSPKKQLQIAEELIMLMAQMPEAEKVIFEQEADHLAETFGGSEPDKLVDFYTKVNEDKKLASLLSRDSLSQAIMSDIADQITARAEAEESSVQDILAETDGHLLEEAGYSLEEAARLWAENCLNDERMFLCLGYLFKHVPDTEKGRVMAAMLLHFNKSDIVFQMLLAYHSRFELVSNLYMHKRNMAKLYARLLRSLCATLGNFVDQGDFSDKTSLGAMAQRVLNQLTQAEEQEEAEVQHVVTKMPGTTRLREAADKSQAKQFIETLELLGKTEPPPASANNSKPTET